MLFWFGSSYNDIYIYNIGQNQWLNILTWTGIIIGSIAVISLIVFVFIKVNQFIFKTTLNKK